MSVELSAASPAAQSLYAGPSPQSPAQVIVSRSTMASRRLLNHAVSGLDHWRDAIWGQKDPGAALAALGTNGAAILAEHAAWETFLESRKPGSTATHSGKRVKPTVTAPDGTVTLAPQKAP